MLRTLLALLATTATVVVAAACDDDSPGRPSGWAAFPDAEVGLEIDEVADGLDGPTQIAPDGRGGYVVAELNGTEGEGSGRVLRFESLPGEPTVLVEGLLTPTGVAVEGDLLWIMEQRTLTVGPLDAPSDRRVVLDDLPFNGRSEGTISVVPSGGILFDTSGRRDGSGLVEGSGVLWYLADPDSETEPFATGFKHAYAHAPLDDDRWLVTEISDGRLDGAAPPDELMVVSAGDDFGYPSCVGDGIPVKETGGTAEQCADTPGSLALFDAHATPTGVAVAPWDPTVAYVALWSEAILVSVPLDGGSAPSEPEIVYGGADRPQHLLAHGDRLLLTDHAAGKILSLAPSVP